MYSPVELKETIAAICTPPGEGGVAIVRISGEKAVEIAGKLFSGPVASYQSHTCHFGVVSDGEGKRIDEALLVLLLGKRSFTGETTIEIQCHGGRFASLKILQAVLSQGARMAKPGEFALRAFLNGKIDLTQAEAIQELICAKNERAFSSASNHLSGSLSRKILSFREELTQAAAILEAWVDFPEEGLLFATTEKICGDLKSTVASMESLLATFDEGQKIRDGITLCLVGPPNAGKSSLMNRLLGKERAIVTPIAGTTRDLIEDDLSMHGLHFRLCDTAGIRTSGDEIEKEGITRALKMMDDADLALLVLDASRPLTPEDLNFIQTVPSRKTLLVWNKIDLPHISQPALAFPLSVCISAKEEKGLKELREKIAEACIARGDLAKEEVMLTSLRHKEALAQAISCIAAVIVGLERGDSPEFLTFEMRSCLAHLGTILGTDVTEDILSSIFSQFCIGK